MAGFVCLGLVMSFKGRTVRRVVSGLGLGFRGLCWRVSGTTRLGGARAARPSTGGSDTDP